MSSDRAFVFKAPYAGPTDIHFHGTENDAYEHADYLNAHGTDATAVVGEHSYDELQAALRRERKSYVARLAASVSA